MTPDSPDPLHDLYGRLNYEFVGMPRAAVLKQGLDQMYQLLERLGNPHHDLRIIHVAGTKGKGSTCTLIAAALQGANYRTGLYTSPHLHHLRERYQIQGVALSLEAVWELWGLVRPIVLAMDQEGPIGPTFFEITTAMAFLAFARAHTEFVVLEVGMGGRLDSTNVVDPLVSVITSISFDHTKILGHTLAAIASEKAGIIKPHRPVISGARADEAVQAIAAQATACQAPLYQLGREFSVEYHPPSPPLESPNFGQITVNTWYRDWGTFPAVFPGAHQADNHALALATLDLLGLQGYPTRKSQIQAQWSQVRFPARMEPFSHSPYILVDGAHNTASAQALALTLVENYPTVPRTLIFGTSKDKDLEGQLSALLPLMDQVIATQYQGNPRAVPAETVAQTMSALLPLGTPPTGPSVSARNTVSPHVAPWPRMALQLAREITPPAGLILITGSLFLAGEVRELLLDNGPRTA